MRIVSVLFALSLLPLAASARADDSLFKYNGKTVEEKDLKPAEQQALYDMRLDAYTRLEQFVDQTALDRYFDDEAKKAGKPRGEVETKILGVGEPTDKEVQDWYEQNKARIPPGYSLEKISGEVKSGLREQAKKEKRDDLIERLKKEGKITFLATEPVAPLMKVDTLGYPAKGAADARVTLIEFADYQCPHCKAAAPIMEALLKKYDGKLRFVFVDFPIKGEFSDLAAQGAFCAEKQGKYWQYHDMAYDKQATLHAKDAANGLAKDLALDQKAFDDCLNSQPARDRIMKAKAEADRLGLNGTPSIFINGRKVRGYEQPDLDKEIQKALKGEQS